MLSHKTHSQTDLGRMSWFHNSIDGIIKHVQFPNCWISIRSTRLTYKIFCGEWYVRRQAHLLIAGHPTVPFSAISFLFPQFSYIFLIFASVFFSCSPPSYSVPTLHFHFKSTSATPSHLIVNIMLGQWDWKSNRDVQQDRYSSECWRQG